MAWDWVSPTGYNDPDNAWIQEDHAYDEATGTYTFTRPYVPPHTWSGFIELTHAALPCDKVRFFAEITLGYFEIVDLDVYYGDDWHHVYQGSFATRTWVEKALGNTYSVTKARLRSYNKNSLYAYGFILYEFDFWAEVAAYYHGLKVQGVGELALCDVGTHPLRIRKGGTTYGMELVDIEDPNASAIRIKTGAGVKAIRKYT